MAPSNPAQLMDNIIQTVHSSDSVTNISNHLRNISPKELRDQALASTLSSGQDPLTLLNPAQHTLPILYILCARLTATGAQVPPFTFIDEFCRNFNPEHARLAPDRVTILAKAIQRHAQNNPRTAVLPLLNLTTRYPPDASYLTTLHPILIMSCLQASTPSLALPVLLAPITSIDTNLSDLTYNDNLLYHYTGGIALTLLKKYDKAEEFFEICVTAPGTVASAVQFEALKKLRLVQLIAKGKTTPLPKYTIPILQRQFKSTPYWNFIQAYPHNEAGLKEILQKEKSTFVAEKNLGLLRQALDRAPRWALKKLTATYLSLNLTDIAKAVKIGSEEEVRGLLLDMIESNDISATISADGSVTFSDPPPQFTRAQVDAVLRDVQDQSALLEYLDKEMAKSKEYLTKVTKGRDDGFPVDEDIYAMDSGSGMGPMWGGDVDLQL